MSGVISPGVLGGAAAQRFECSRAGCRDEAAFALLWRNPKIHAIDRRKTWLACEPHLEYLREFLAARDFPLEVRTIEELDD
ncbi:hypothetical protein ACXR2W_02720 [Leucobacter sp. HY1908]